MTNIDISSALKAKSDQLNADDLIAGPITVKIRDVKNTGGEQPVSVFYDGDNGKPWKPAKAALRCLALIWGPNAAKWIGMSLTLYRDETVTWARAQVGGIRVSHMEGLASTRTLHIAKARGKKEPVSVKPLTVEKASKADKFRARLFQVAEDPEASVADAWAKIDEAMQFELGTDLLDQLKAIEAAAQEHRATDPNAAVDALNDAIGGE